MKAVICFIDLVVQKSLGVHEFTSGPDCVLRLELKKANHGVNLGSVVINKGDQVLAIHAWNEPMPKIPVEGPNLEWALHLR